MHPAKHGAWLVPLLALILYLAHGFLSPPGGRPASPPPDSYPGVSPSPSDIRSDQNTDIPQKAYDTLAYIRSHHGDAPPGFVGGRTFENREHRLPAGGSYQEYDVDPKTRGEDRNAERLIVDADSGKAWYTGDHYRTFIPIDPGPPRGAR
jgi:ribonuclease T1